MASGGGLWPTPLLLGVRMSLELVRARINQAAHAAERPAESVTLIAVSKTHGPEVIRPALLAGHRVFGENRVQEAAEKWPPLRAEFPGIELHLIGPLQTNKVKAAFDVFDVIETLDRPALAEKIAREAARRGQCPKLLIQVNTGREPQKAGVDPAEVANFLAYCRKLGLAPVGLMAIPPVADPPSAHFAFLAKLGRELGLSVISMGMSADYETAIALGATHVRIGSAIFGHRSGPNDHTAAASPMSDQPEQMGG